MRLSSSRLLLLAAVTTVSSAAEKPQVIPPERLQNYWLLADTGSPMMPNSGKNLDAPSCAAVSYVVEKDGTTSHVKLEKIVPDGDLAKVAVSVVSNMHFAAAPQNQGKTPVSTYVVMPFNLPNANSTNVADRAQRARALDACHLDNYGSAPKENVVPIR